MSERDGIMDSLSDLIDDFDEIPRVAHERYRQYDPLHLMEHDRRAAAACVYAHMLAEAERRLADRSGVVPKDIRGQKLWIIGDRAVIRFKKMDEDGHSRNYPTKQAQDFDKGLPLPNLPAAAPRLTVGYLLDITETEYVRTQVAKPCGRRDIDWCVAIVPAGEPLVEGKRWFDVTKQQRFP